MMIFVVFFVFAASSLALLLTRSVFADLRTVNVLSTSKQAYLTAEAQAEDVAFRRIFGFYDVDLVETMDFAGGTAVSSTTEDTFNEETTIVSRADLNGVIRESEIILTLGAGDAFNYGIQAGNGGIDMANSAEVEGNVYSNGPVTGQGSSQIRGDAVSAGPTGLIDSVHATGSVWANTLSDSLVEGDACYNATIVPSTVNGTRTTPCANKPTSSFPIADETVEEWKDAIEDYGTYIPATDPDCTDDGVYTIDYDTTIGYLKVECDLDIAETGSDIIVTMDGPVWVEGNLTFTQGPEIQVDPSLGRRSTQFIADNESNNITSGQIEIRNTTIFTGTGHPSSIILLLSQNEAAETGGPEEAIGVNQSAIGDVMVYAGHGLIDVRNGISLKEVTAYQLDIGQNSNVIYDEGLQNLLFTSGPGGEYVLTQWRETY